MIGGNPTESCKRFGGENGTGRVRRVPQENRLGFVGHSGSDRARIECEAIGGSARSNLNLVSAAGFARIAVSGAVLLANDPAAEVRHFMDIFANVSSPLH